jgi:hypothetical protein
MCYQKEGALGANLLFTFYSSGFLNNPPFGRCTLYLLSLVQLERGRKLIIGFKEV